MQRTGNFLVFAIVCDIGNTKISDQLIYSILKVKTSAANEQCYGDRVDEKTPKFQSIRQQLRGPCSKMTGWLQSVGKMFVCWLHLQDSACRHSC